MTFPEKAIRRRKIVSALRKGDDPKKVSESFRVTRQYVSKLARDAGLRLRRAYQ